MKAIFIALSILLIAFSCKKSSEQSIDSEMPTAADSLQVIALEKSLDSLNALPHPASQPISIGSINTLTSGSNVGSDDIGAYICGGIAAVKIMKRLYNVLYKYFSKKWTVIVYQDGFCCFNHVRSYRTIDDIVSTVMGKGGDCDWATWHGQQVCLRNKNDANSMIRKHGKIVKIAFIDHPTNNCGK